MLHAWTYETAYSPIVLQLEIDLPLHERCRAAHDRTRLASMVGIFGPAFRATALQSLRASKLRMTEGDPPPVSHASLRGLPRASVASGARVKRLRNTMPLPNTLHQVSRPTTEPRAASKTAMVHQAAWD
jgi:hypothetical protein